MSELDSSDLTGCLSSIRFLDAGGAEREAGHPEGAGAQEAGSVAAARRAEGGGGRALLRGGDGLVQREDGERRDADRQRRGERLQHHHPVWAEGGEAAGAHNKHTHSNTHTHTHSNTTVQQTRWKMTITWRSILKRSFCLCSCSGPTSRPCWLTWTAWRWTASTPCSGCSSPRDPSSRRWTSTSWRPSCRGRSGSISWWSLQASTDSPNPTDAGGAWEQNKEDTLHSCAVGNKGKHSSPHLLGRNTTRITHFSSQ